MSRYRVEYIFVLLMGLLYAPVQAKELSNMEYALKHTRAEKYTRTSDGKQLNYRIHRPDVEAAPTGTKLPVVILLHGSGERGDNNRSQLVHGVGPILRYAESARQALILIAPQCPRGKRWVEVDWSAPQHRMPPAPSENMGLLLELLDKLAADPAVDTERIYLTGPSMGGYGTWDALQRRPNFFAAAVPVCGGGDVQQVKQLVHLPLWVFHGGQDKVVPTQRSRDMVRAIKEAGSRRIRYTEYPGVGHNSWKATYDDPVMLKWLFEQRRVSRP